MTKQAALPSARRPLRTGGRAAAVTVLTVIVTTAPPALAVPPDGWVEADPVSPLNFILVLAIIPLGLALVIALLAALPSMMRPETAYVPGLSWRHEPEWFGGPRGGVAKAGEADQAKQIEGAEDRGGASARW